MTKRTDNGETITINIRDVLRHPLGIVLVMLATGGVGAGATSTFGLATKADIAAVSDQVRGLERKVETLILEREIEKRLHNAHHYGGTTEPVPGGT